MFGSVFIVAAPLIQTEGLAKRRLGLRGGRVRYVGGEIEVGPDQREAVALDLEACLQLALGIADPAGPADKEAIRQAGRFEVRELRELVAAGRLVENADERCPDALRELDEAGTRAVRQRE